MFNQPYQVSYENLVDTGGMSKARSQVSLTHVIAQAASQVRTPIVLALDKLSKMTKILS